ncbi:MarR family winged helix-turn-helix transcriptional regulator [Lysinimonas soli]|uniref:MarR family winged helix-turn-helix transcriptional regulator n=1 Tax=Lysinimonas soli TaxID=1074233 RepID=A0ABW0NK84_9MICO
MEARRSRRPEAIVAFSDLVRVETRLYNALDAVLREAHGVTLGAFEFLRYIRAHDSARVADLAAAFAIGVGATSKGVDRMEANGWVERLANPANRRSSLLAVTAAGERLIDLATPTFDTEFARLTSSVDPAALAALVQTLGVLRGELESRGVGQPAG